MVVGLIVFLSSANLICRSTNISKCFIESLGFRDNESRLYIYIKKISQNRLNELHYSEVREALYEGRAKSSVTNRLP